MKASPPDFLQTEGLSLILFGGKGGVGKTTFACATAVHLAQAQPSRSVVLVSTDPAHSTTHALSPHLENWGPNLKLFELSAEIVQAAVISHWKSTLLKLGSLGSIFSESDLDPLFSMALPAADELLFFYQISTLMKENPDSLLVIDTAPTGHTLRLLQTGKFFDGFFAACKTLLLKPQYLQKSFGGKSNSTIEQLEHFIRDENANMQTFVARLQNRQLSRFVVISLLERVVVAETVRLLEELTTLQIPVLEIVFNHVCVPSTCPACLFEHEAQKLEYQNFLPGHSNLALFLKSTSEAEPLGTAALACFEDSLMSPSELFDFTEGSPQKTFTFQPSRSLSSAALFLNPDVRLSFFSGKGGVGKSTVAASYAAGMAAFARGKQKILLVSVDPAHSLTDVLKLEYGTERSAFSAHLDVWQLNSANALQVIFDALESELNDVMSRKTGDMTLQYDIASIRALMDMAPPGLDEVLALKMIAQVLDKEPETFVVVDTAPTGHFLRLIHLPDIVEQWISEILRILLRYKETLWLPNFTMTLTTLARTFRKFSARIKNPESCEHFVVAIPTELCFQETAALFAHFKSLNIRLSGLCLNRVRTLEKSCPFCSSVSSQQNVMLERFTKLSNGSGVRMAKIPLFYTSDAQDVLPLIATEIGNAFKI